MARAFPLGLGPNREDAYIVRISIQSERLFGSSNGAPNMQTIEGRLPQDIEVSLSSTFSEQYQHAGKGFIDFLSLATTGNVIGLPGIFSTARWQGTSGITFNLDIDFIAEDSSASDVMRPVRILQKLVVPSQGEDFGREELNNVVEAAGEDGEQLAATLELVRTNPETFTGQVRQTADGLASAFSIRPPGPLPISNARVRARSDSVIIYFGNFLLLPSVIIESVNVTFSGIMTTERLPISAKATLSVKCGEATTTGLLQRMYERRAEHFS